MRLNNISNSMKPFWLVLVGNMFQHFQGECIDDYCNGDWTKTLENCWTDSTCIRVMNVVHGGDWNISLPYDSFPAFQKADDKGADAVKGHKIFRW